MIVPVVVVAVVAVIDGLERRQGPLIPLSLSRSLARSRVASFILTLFPLAVTSLFCFGDSRSSPASAGVLICALPLRIIKYIL